MHGFTNYQRDSLITLIGHARSHNHHRLSTFQQLGRMLRPELETAFRRLFVEHWPDYARLGHKSVHD